MSELDLDTLQRWAATAPDSGVLLHVSDALALIALAREAVALRERMDAAREMVEKAGIALPVRRNGDADFRIVDGDGLVIAGGVHDEDSETAAAIVARERNPWRPIEGAPGRKVLVGGNHDNYPARRYLDAGFADVRGVVVLEGNILLTHIPVEPEQFGRFRVNVHGHTHARCLDDERYVCVSLEQTDYRPVALDEIAPTSA
jgi:hypothetical protein